MKREAAVKPLGTYYKNSRKGTGLKGIPFTIWLYPNMVDVETLRKLAEDGLAEVTLRIQSGSEHIRREIFCRGETQRDILAAVSAVRKAGVAWVTCDFTLQHPFETTQDLQETYWLVKQLCPPFTLSLHRLSLRPGTNIAKLAIKQGYYTEKELAAMLDAPAEERLLSYWKRDGGIKNQLWYQLIFCLQFCILRRIVSRYESEPVKYRRRIRICYWLATLAFHIRRLRKRVWFVWRRIRMGAGA